MVVIGRNAPYRPHWHFSKWHGDLALFWDIVTGDFHHLHVMPWGTTLP